LICSKNLKKSDKQVSQGFLRLCFPRNPMLADYKSNATPMCAAAF